MIQLALFLFLSIPTLGHGWNNTFSPWVMVVGGKVSPILLGYSSRATLISLDEERFPVPWCLRRLRNYPYPTKGMVGGVGTKGTVSVCT